MNIAQVQSLLAQAQQGSARKADASPAQEFADLLSQTSKEQQSAQQAFERYATAGEGELHDVMSQIAKADVTFRFLLEVRNKLTEAYQEVSKLPV